MDNERGTEGDIVREMERKVTEQRYKNELCTLLEGGWTECECALCLCIYLYSVLGVLFLGIKAKMCHCPWGCRVEKANPLIL